MNKISVVKHGPLYRARSLVPVSLGSPYRGFALLRDAVVVTWAWSEDRAAERNREKRQRIIEADRRWKDKRNRKTRVYDA